MVMATSRLSDGDKKNKKKQEKKVQESCGIGGCDSDKLKSNKEGGADTRYRKEVIYTTKKNEPTQTKVVEKSNLVVSDALKEQEKPETKGVIFKGQTSQKTTDSGNKNSEEAKVKETRYYKKRTKIGQILTGQEEKQKGGVLESQTKKGETEVITFKGKGRGAKKFVEKKDIKEVEKEGYENEMAKTAKKRDILGNLPVGESDAAKNTVYYRKKLSGGTDTDYKIGDASADKEWRVGKNQFKADVTEIRKANKKKDTKVKRNALSKLRVNNG